MIDVELSNIWGSVRAKRTPRLPQPRKLPPLNNPYYL